jgi:hypothetical protein
LAQHKRPSYPQLAATRQRTVGVEYEFRGGNLYMTPLQGSYMSFDGDGRPYQSTEDKIAIVERLDAFDAIEQEKCKPVPYLAVVRAGKNELKRNRWQPSLTDKELIVADLLGRGRPRDTKAIPILKPERR